MNILDDYIGTGHGMENLKSALEEIDNDTKTLVVSGLDAQLLSLAPDSEKVNSMSKPGSIPCFVTTPAFLDEFENGNGLHLAHLSEKHFTPEVLQEIKKNNELILYLKDEPFIVSNKAIAKLGRFARATGDVNAKNTLVRNLSFATGLYRFNDKMTLVYRTEELPSGKCENKVFAFASTKFSPFRQQDIVPLVEKITEGSAVDIEYDIRQILTHVTVRFNEENIYPEVILKASSVGEASFSASVNCVIPGYGEILTKQVTCREDEEFPDYLKDLVNECKNVTAKDVEKLKTVQFNTHEEIEEHAEHCFKGFDMIAEASGSSKKKLLERAKDQIRDKESATLQELFFLTVETIFSDTGDNFRKRANAAEAAKILLYTILPTYHLD